MKLSEFLTAHMQEILAEWDDYAERMTPAADDMTARELRDHAAQMLQAIAVQLDSPQPVPDVAEAGEADGAAKAGGEIPESPAAKHGALRQEHRFTLLQLSSEFRTLRATILKLWLPHVRNLPESLASVVRFNEAVDQALAESIVTYSERAQAEHDLFIAILGHDLRGPLATMTMAGGLLREPGLSVKRAGVLGGSVATAASQMTSMVNDLLGLARSRLSCGMPIAREPVDALRVCEAAIADAAAMYPDCEFVLPDRPSLPGRFDAVRLQQLVTNLLVNAAQHGARHCPVQLVTAGDATTVTLRVTNTGTPIPVESLECIFDPMRRLGEVSGHVVEAGARTSLGLGLFIAREIALGHGGRIAVTSNESEGTSFVVTLPREADQDAPATHQEHGSRTTTS
ncbi:sensor histidine kinase [Alkalisalibacterium limincola]|uniref:histidine kinase n=1 Tax=Alkalisalibacterium limincola TaxID=2699169 RepID=A0A5C8KSF6_9GAMM|nr:sensor histidine kinase [Alkalisalibacterium limincola]TXK62222.1 HAMP domain-containing histidine kinase [Alkalisalibacterium limincola]